MRASAASYAVMIFLLSNSSAFGQDWRDQAQQSLDALGSVTGLITQDNMLDTVTSFETATPEEAGISAGDIADEVFNERVSNSVAARGYGAQVDSALTRPDVTLEADALSLADAAVSGSQAVAGGLFEPGGEFCGASLDVTPRDEVLSCTSVVDRAYETCSETRSIDTDRDDRWACSTQDSDYKKRCSQGVDWICSGETGATCTQASLSVPASAVWRAGASGVDLSGTVSTDAACTLQSDSFTITATHAIDLRSLIVDQVSFNGAAQIRVNGVNIWTYGTSALGDLNIRNRDCGKGCSRIAAYAGSTWIEDCSSALRSANPQINLLDVVASATRGPSNIVGHEVVLDHQADVSWTIEVSRINRDETTVGMGITVAGSCCAAWSADTGGACE